MRQESQAGRNNGDIDSIIHQVFEHATVGICYMAERKFLHVNPYMEEMLGYSDGELTGQSVQIVYANEADFRSVGDVLKAFPKSNRYEHERPLVTKSGGTLWCHISGSLIDPDDPDSSSVWVVQDISKRKRIQDELTRTKTALEHIVERRTLNMQRINKELRDENDKRRQSERSMLEGREQYRIVIRNAPVGVVLTDKNHRVIEINPCALEVFGAKDLNHFNDVVRETTVYRLRSHIRESLESFLLTIAKEINLTHSPRAFQWTSSDGSTHWMIATSVSIPVRGLGVAIFFDDRTQEQAAIDSEHGQREQLAHAGRIALAGQIATSLAHELGQPLNACQSYAAGIEHKLADSLAEDPEAKDALKRIQRHLKQSGDIIRNVRSFVSQQRHSDEHINLALLIDETIDLLQIPMRGVEIHYAPKPSQKGLMVSGNRVEIQQVLVNLIVNAIQSMQEAKVAKPRLYVRLAGRRSEITVSIIDNGPGVPPSQVDAIFKPYNTTKPGGLGLGLMMGRAIIESHDGHLTVDTNRKRGARFDVRLPRLDSRP